MPATADLTPVLPALYTQQTLSPQENLTLKIDMARIRYMSTERFQRPHLEDLVIDPKNAKCLEDAIGARSIDEDSGTYSIRSSTAEIGAMTGMDEQAVLLRAIIGHIRHRGSKRALPQIPEEYALMRKHGGFNVGLKIPALTVAATVGPQGLADVDIYRSFVVPQVYKWNERRELSEDPHFHICVNGAKRYRSLTSNQTDLPTVIGPTEKAEPSDITYLFAHFGNSMITKLILDARLPAITNIGREVSGSGRHKYYQAVADVDPTNVPRGRHLVPCKHFAAWVDQVVVSSYLETGSPPVSNSDMRVLAGWLNWMSEKDRKVSLAQKAAGSLSTEST